MKTLIAGADRDGVRLLLIDQAQVLADEYIAARASHRNERAILEMALHTVGLTWSDIGAFVALTVPHSHTSVRVIRTIVHTTAWYYGKPFYAVDCEELQAEAAVLVERLKAVVGKGLVAPENR